MAQASLTLEELKARMTDDQRREMAEIVAAEVKRREGMKQAGLGGARPAEKSNVRSSRIGKGLPAEALGEVYGDIHDRVKELRMKQLDEKIAETKQLSRVVPRGTARGGRGAALVNPKNMMILGIVALGVMKVVLGGSDKPAETTAPPAVVATEEAAKPETQSALLTATATDVTQAPKAVVASEPERKLSGWTAAEKQVLTELDARRVELERRRQELDQREEDIKSQGAALAERLAELKSLTTRVSQVRKERDNQYEARLEQLANVYGSMAPNEAAPLVGKLDEDTALALLKRMPGKRMGQILSMMDPERAVELTTVLSDKTKLDNDIPAVPHN